MRNIKYAIIAASVIMMLQEQADAMKYHRLTPFSHEINYSYISAQHITPCDSNNMQIMSRTTSSLSRFVNTDLEKDCDDADGDESINPFDKYF